MNVFLYQIRITNNKDLMLLYHTLTPEYLILFTARADLVDWQSWAVLNNPWQPLDGASI